MKEKITRRDEVMVFIENDLHAEDIQITENTISFIWNNMEFVVDFNNNCFYSSRWNVRGSIDNLITSFNCIQDSIEYAETFGILENEKYQDQIWNRIGW